MIKPEEYSVDRWVVLMPCKGRDHGIIKERPSYRVAGFPKGAEGARKRMAALGPDAVTVLFEANEVVRKGDRVAASDVNRRMHLPEEDA